MASARPVVITMTDMRSTGIAGWAWSAQFEGVETEGQLDVVERQGCHFAQGFFFHRPITEREIETLLAEKDTFQPAKV